MTDRTNAASEARKVLQSVKDRLAQVAGSKVNEATTRNYFITPLLGALGYRSIDDLKFEEYLPDGRTFLDYRLFVDGKARVAIEAKSLELTLNEQHAAQAVQYASLLGDPWAVITNAREWRLYDTFAQVPLAEKHILTLDLVSWETDAQFALLFDQLWICSRESFQTDGGPMSWLGKKRIDQFLRHALTDADSPEIRYIRKRLHDNGMTATADQVATWLQVQLHIDTVSPEAAYAPVMARAGGHATKEASPMHTIDSSPLVQESNYWLVPAGKRQGLEAIEYLRMWLPRGYWALGTKTPGRKAIRGGDRVCFYAAGLHEVVATAVVGRELDQMITPAEWPEPRVQAEPLYKMPLADVTWLASPVKLDAVLRSKLAALDGKFVNNWSFFVQTPRRIVKGDFDLLTQG